MSKNVLQFRWNIGHPALSEVYAMAMIPPHMEAAYDRGKKKDENRCPNDGCGLRWVPDKNNPSVLRCPSNCTMKRAKQLPWTAQDERKMSQRDEAQEFAGLTASLAAE